MTGSHFTRLSAGLAISLSLCAGFGAASAQAAANDDIRALMAEARGSGVPERYAPAAALIDERLAKAPDDVALLTLRATVRQATHEFGAALADLDRVLRLRPGDRQARLTRAFLRTTVGDTEGAAHDCAALPARAGKLVRTACAARVLDATGRSAEAASLLQRAAAGAPPALRVWVHELLAAFAERAGDRAGAEGHHEALRALAPGEERYGAAHAGFLRRAGRPAEALDRLPEAETDAGLLERALALRATGHPDGPEIAVLEKRFAADLAAGHEGHLRETAQFYLEILGDGAGAYRLAKRNWELQKEPEDRALLLDAATAAGAERAAEAD